MAAAAAGGRGGRGAAGALPWRVLVFGVRAGRAAGLVGAARRRRVAGLRGGGARQLHSTRKRGAGPGRRGRMILHPHTGEGLEGSCKKNAHTPGIDYIHYTI